MERKNDLPIKELSSRQSYRHTKQGYLHSRSKRDTKRQFHFTFHSNQNSGSMFGFTTDVRVCQDKISFVTCIPNDRNDYDPNKNLRRPYGPATVNLSRMTLGTFQLSAEPSMDPTRTSEKPDTSTVSIASQMIASLKVRICSSSSSSSS